jgi:hypothetical protein
MLPRVVAEETLDHLAPDNPAAKRSRRDLVRVHHAMGTRAIVSRSWQDLVSPERAREPLRILEIGAGDATLLLGVARSLNPRWPRVQLTLLDRQDIVCASTLAAYAALGWVAQTRVVDVLSWADQPDVDLTGTPLPRWDLITASLFLHHFEGDPLDRLLASVASRSDRFFACEPNRSWLSLAGGHLVGVIGVNAVTREDAVLSVHAGFRRQEISALWPRGGHDWHLRERAAGLFSHCFSARRTAVD